MEKDVRQPRRSPCRARERCRPHAAETKDPGPQRCRRAGPAKTVVLLAHADVIGRVSGTYRAGRRTRTFGSSACCSTWHLLLRSIRRSHRNEFGGGLPGSSRRKFRAARMIPRRPGAMGTPLTTETQDRVNIRFRAVVPCIREGRPVRLGQAHGCGAARRSVEQRVVRLYQLYRARDGEVVWLEWEVTERMPLTGGERAHGPAADVPTLIRHRNFTGRRSGGTRSGPAALVCERRRSGKTLTREVVSDVWRQA